MTGEAGERMEKREEKNPIYFWRPTNACRDQDANRVPRSWNRPQMSVPNANSFVQQTARKAQHTECPGKAADKARL